MVHPEWVSHTHTRPDLNIPGSLYVTDVTEGYFTLEVFRPKEFTLEAQMSRPVLRCAGVV